MWTVILEANPIPNTQIPVTYEDLQGIYWALSIISESLRSCILHYGTGILAIPPTDE